MTTSTSSPVTAASLFASAQQNGTLDPAAMAVIVPNMGANITAGLGIVADDVQASNVCLVALLLDDSSSIADGNNTMNVIDGTNLVLDAVGGSKEDGILGYIGTLNRGILSPFATLTNTKRPDTNNFTPSGCTPLYDRTAELIATVIAKTEEFQNNGVPCRSVVMIVTDGSDVGSRTHRTPESIQPLVAAALRTEQHIICAMGIDDGATDFRSIFRRMGLRDQWILTPKNTASEIRKAFAMFSKSAARASIATTGGQFSQVAAGGFGS